MKVKDKIKNRIALSCVVLGGLLWLCGCSGPSEDIAADNSTLQYEDSYTGQDEGTEESLIYAGSMETVYAENFAVDYYEGGYTLLTTKKDGAEFLVVPEGKEVPAGIDEDIVVIKRPVEDIYLVASSVMDMFNGLDALDTISFSGQKADGWYIDGAREAMERGDIVYAGKYNKPDYELIVSEGCSLAIENSMINHSPEVKEKLEEFGIPVLIEYSSYESHPLGRVEWVRFFGALLGKEEEADKIFDEQVKILTEIQTQISKKNNSTNNDANNTVAFFYITSNGLVQVRVSSDYIPKLIELAGGKYIFDNIGDENSARSTMNLQVEEFYNGAKDADYLIYNSSIDGGVESIDELLEKCGLLADFKAVQTGNVWCTTNDMYQQSLSIGYLCGDIYSMLSGEEGEMRYLFKLE